MCRIVALPWLAAAFLLFSATAIADVKKWVDPDGRVNYGDDPPLGAVIVPFSIRPNQIESERLGLRPANYPDDSAAFPRADVKRPLPGWSWKFGIRQ
jgi:hypothetical protein